MYFTSNASLSPLNHILMSAFFSDFDTSFNIRIFLYMKNSLFLQELFHIHLFHLNTFCCFHICLTQIFTYTLSNIFKFTQIQNLLSNFFSKKNLKCQLLCL
jgi:hypothetical protein